MLDNCFQAIRRLIAPISRRVRAIHIKAGVAEIELSPVSDTSFTRAQDEWELRHEIWLLAGEEAYRAKDGGRRLQELQVPEVQAVENYLAENPEMRRWVECNIKAGTCAAAVAELRNKRRQFRLARLREIGELQRRKTNPEFDWMRQVGQRR